jgi:gamma-glutamylcyclotransferase (GGCT)/AIG2-like uncharacterized protein YtfP
LKVNYLSNNNLKFAAMTLVFVYGSLLSGLFNHHVLFNSNPKFISKGITLKPFFMTAGSIENYPFLTEEPLNDAQISNQIIGEIYEVNYDGMKLLDELEEYPHVYDRKEIEILNIETNTLMPCFVYFLVNHEISSQIKESFSITYFDVSNGDFKNYLQLS